MAFLPFGDRSQRHLKKAMDPRESLLVADLGKANFSAAMSNVEEPKGGMLRTSLGPVKARQC